MEAQDNREYYNYPSNWPKPTDTIGRTSEKRRAYLKAYNERWRAEHRDYIRAYDRKRRAQQTEAQKRRSQTLHREHLRTEKAKASRRRYRAEHREEINAKHRAWYAANKAEQNRKERLRKLRKVMNRRHD
jgi:hypothetical protein